MLRLVDLGRRLALALLGLHSGRLWSMSEKRKGRRRTGRRVAEGGGVRRGVLDCAHLFILGVNLERALEGVHRLVELLRHKLHVALLAQRAHVLGVKLEGLGR